MNGNLYFPGMEAWVRPPDLPKRKKRSHGPRDLVDVLTVYGKRCAGEIFPFQKTLARVMGACTRTIQRWLAVAIKAGWLTVRRGQNGSNRYFLCSKGLSPQMSHPLKDDSEPYSSTREAEQTVQVYTTASLPKPRIERLPPIPIKPPWTVNEFGRQVIDPIWSRIHGVLRKAQDRIRRARNPEAYQQAIIRAELPQ